MIIILSIFFCPNERIELLTERKRIVQSLCERNTVFADGRVEIDRLVDRGHHRKTNCFNQQSQL